MVVLLSGELKDLLTSLDIGDDSPIILTTTDKQWAVLEVPRETQDTGRVHIIVSGNWVRWITKVPNVECWVVVVIRGCNKLRGNIGWPHELDFSFGWGFVLLHGPKVVIDWGLGSHWGISEIKDFFVHFQIPDDDFAIFGSWRQNVLDDSIPRDTGDACIFMVVGCARLEDIRLLDVVTQILDKYLSSTRGQ